MERILFNAHKLMLFHVNYETLIRFTRKMEKKNLNEFNLTTGR